MEVPQTCESGPSARAATAKNRTQHGKPTSNNADLPAVQPDGCWSCAGEYLKPNYYCAECGRNNFDPEFPDADVLRDSNEPPAHLADPVVRWMRVERAKWERATRGRIVSQVDQLVVLRLSSWGNTDGSNCHPGTKLLAEACLKSEKTIKRSVAWLEEHGWITCTAKAVPKAWKAAVWACTVPAPVAVELGIWDSDPDVMWMERPAGMAKRPGMRNRPAPSKPGPKPRVRTDTREGGNGLMPGQSAFQGVTSSVSKGQEFSPGDDDRVSNGVSNGVRAESVWSPRGRTKESAGQEAALPETLPETLPNTLSTPIGEGFLGVKNSLLGVKNSLSRGHLDDPPPGPTTPGPISSGPTFLLDSSDEDQKQPLASSLPRASSRRREEDPMLKEQEDVRAERLPDTSTFTSDPWWADPDPRTVDRPLHLTSVLIGWDDLDDLDFEGVENELLNRFALRAWAGGIEVHEEIMDITDAGVRLRLERGDSHQDVAAYLSGQLIAQIPLTPCAA